MGATYVVVNRLDRWALADSYPQPDSNRRRRRERAVS